MLYLISLEGLAGLVLGRRVPWAWETPTRLLHEGLGELDAVPIRINTSLTVFSMVQSPVSSTIHPSLGIGSK